jgi:hypothetical protein
MYQEVDPAEIMRNAGRLLSQCTVQDLGITFTRQESFDYAARTYRVSNSDGSEAHVSEHIDNIANGDFKDLVQIVMNGENNAFLSALMCNFVRQYGEPAILVGYYHPNAIFESMKACFIPNKKKNLATLSNKDMLNFEASPSSDLIRKRIEVQELYYMATRYFETRGIE